LYYQVRGMTIRQEESSQPKVRCVTGSLTMEKKGLDGRKKKARKNQR